MLYSANRMMMMIITTTTKIKTSVIYRVLTVCQALCSVVGGSCKLTVTLDLLEFAWNSSTFVLLKADIFSSSFPDLCFYSPFKYCTNFYFPPFPLNILSIVSVCPTSPWVIYFCVNDLHLISYLVQSFKGIIW